MVLLAILSSAAAAALLVGPRAQLSLSPSTRGWRPPVVSSATLAGGAAAVAALVVLPWPLAAAGAPLAGVVAARVVARLEPAASRRRRARLESALPHVVDLMSTCLAAGASPYGALARIAEAVPAPMGEELSAFAARLGLGADPGSVWASMAAHPQLGPLGRAVHRSFETGASVAESLGRLGRELRAGRRAHQEGRARTVEVRASLPLGLCLLPAFVLIGVVPMVASSFSLTFLSW